MAVPSKRVYIFNCDSTYNLDIVERFLVEADKKYGFRISVDKLYFGLQRMGEVVKTGLPTLSMDFAIFVVQANESRLSINEDNAGIGYAKFYKALLQKTGDKVLIVIGGDTYYKDDDEKDRSVISRWARRKVASQFNEEYLDGRKSFIFSWDKKHRLIHEEALRHYFDSSKKGIKFVYTPPPKPQPRPIKPASIPAVTTRGEPYLVDDDRRGLIKDEEERNRRRSPFSEQEALSRELKIGVEEPSYGGAGNSGTSGVYPAGKVLLEARLRYGRINYQPEARVEYRERWQPPDWQLAHLRERYKGTPEATVRFVSDGYGGVNPVVDEPDFTDCLSACCTWIWRCLVACFLGLAHCLGLFWGWLCNEPRRR